MKAFLHIPKTGGRSIALSHGAFTANGVIGGHIPSRLLEEPCDLWTVVRDPVDRIYSMFQYCWRFDESFDSFLDHLESEPVVWQATRKPGKRERMRLQALQRLESNDYGQSNEDKVRRCIDKKIHKWFVEKQTDEVRIFKKLLNVPGVNLPTQWEYIQNDVGHDIEIVHFKDSKRIAELAGGTIKHRNKGDYTSEEKKKDLTKTRIERIKMLCKADYDNISCLR